MIKCTGELDELFKIVYFISATQQHLVKVAQENVSFLNTSSNTNNRKLNSVQNTNRICLAQREDSAAKSISTRGATYQISCVLQQTVPEWRSCEGFLLLNKRLSEDVTAFII
jgi:hypothetical protein